LNLFHLLESTSRRYPDAIAVCRGAELIYTYSALYRRACSLAAALAAQTNPGDRIVIVAKNCPEYIEVMFAAWAAGLVLVPLNCKLHIREMVAIIEDADPGVIIASVDFPDLMSSSFYAGKIVNIGGALYSRWLTTEPSPPLNVASDSLAWLFYTSGTTGRSKGAMLTHRNLLSMTIAHLADFEELGTNSSIIHSAPMSHGSGLYVLPYVWRGGRHVIPVSGAYDPVEFLELCDIHPGCGAFLAPTMLKRLRVILEQRNNRPKHLRSIIYGGGPMYVKELRASLKSFGSILSQLYGQGECPMTISGLRRADHDTDEESVLSSVGWPRSGIEIKIARESGEALAVGQTGEIMCRGDVVMRGYWRQPHASAEAFCDGWLRTGDIGSLDEDGMLTLRDRSKDVIISGGTNIYPREVEEVLITVPGVAEVSVVGFPNEEWGEEVVAFIVKEPQTDVTLATLDACCLATIARFKRPKRYFFLDELPKSEYGKVLKRELIQRLMSNNMRA
jgi:acyl-CoA synthetase (AMP-forming)/AMP-acid ligase II